MHKITSRIYSNCSNYSSLFFKSFEISLLFVWFHKKNVGLQLAVQVCCLFYYFLYTTFFKGNVEWDFWWVLLFF